MFIIILMFDIIRFHIPELYIMFLVGRMGFRLVSEMVASGNGF